MRHVRLLLPAVLAACAEAPTTPAPDPAIALKVTPATVSFVAGSSTTIEIEVIRSGGYSGNVHLGLETLPEGLQATVTPPLLSPGQSRATLEIASAPGTPAGSLPLTVWARASGVQPAVAPVSLYLHPGPDFRIEVLTTAVEAGPGGETTARVRVLRTLGFGAPVRLELAHPPAGLTATVTADRNDANLLNVALGVEPTAALGLHQLQLEATAAGHPARTGRLDLRVLPPGAGGPVTWSFCPDQPAWAAFQNGYLGPWVPVAAAGNAYTFPFDKPVGAIAVAWEGSVRLYHGSVAELREQFPASCAPPRPSIVAIDLQEVTSADTVLVYSRGNQSGSWATRPLWPRILATAEEGTVDLVAVLTRGYHTSTRVPAGVIMYRDVPTPAGTPLVARWTTDKVLPVQRQVTVPNRTASLSGGSVIHTRNGTAAPLGWQGGTGTTLTWFGLPESAREAGELHEVTVNDWDPVSGSRGVTHFIGAATDLVLMLGPQHPSLRGGRILAGPYVRPTVKGQIPVEYRDRLEFIWADHDGDGSNVCATFWRGYGLDAGELDFTFPDFSGLPGWRNQWGLDATRTFYTVWVEGWNGAPGPGRRPHGQGGTIHYATTGSWLE